MRTFAWGRVLAAMVTPMDSKGNVNYGLAANLSRDLIDNGCDGVVVSGTTGEAATLSREEKLKLFAEVKRAVGAKGRVIAGVGSNCTRETLDLIWEAERLPLDGYMVITPYYNKPNLSGLREHYQAVDTASSRPIMLYNVPSRTGLDMDLNAYEIVLTHCPKITAVKEASSNLEKGSQLTASFPGVDFFSGNDSLLLPLLAVGFKGVVSVAANLVPWSLAKIASLADSGDWSGARNENNRLFPLFKALFLETNPVPVKAALEIQGWPVGAPRLPLGKLAPVNRERLAALVPQYRRERV